MDRTRDEKGNFKETNPLWVYTRKWLKGGKDSRLEDKHEGSIISRSWRCCCLFFGGKRRKILSEDKRTNKHERLWWWQVSHTIYAFGSNSLTCVLSSSSCFSTNEMYTAKHSMSATNHTTHTDLSLRVALRTEKMKKVYVVRLMNYTQTFSLIHSKTNREETSHWNRETCHTVSFCHSLSQCFTR